MVVPTNIIEVEDNESNVNIRDKKAIDNYMLHYRRFAYLRLVKITNLYKVTTIKNAIKITKCTC